jgi:hypothetical protein
MNGGLAGVFWAYIWTFGQSQLHLFVHEVAHRFQVGFGFVIMSLAEMASM